MNNEEKERRFKYPDPNQFYLDRRVRSIYWGGTLWTAAICGRRGEEELLLKGFNAPLHLSGDGGRDRGAGRGIGSSGSASITLTGHRGVVYHPLPAALGDSLFLYWAELEGKAADPAWSIRRCLVDIQAGVFSPAEEVVRCGGAVYSLAVTEFAGHHYLAWTEIREDSLPLFLYRVEDYGAKAKAVRVFSREEETAFRVDITSTTEGIALAWDRWESTKEGQPKNGQYEIRLALLSNKDNPENTAESNCSSRSDFDLHREHAFNRPGEDWNQVKLVSGKDRILAVWLATSEVKDGLGIYDRRSRIRGCQILSFKEDPITLTDGENREDPENIGDLREGLLPRTASKGYVGLRRNPQLTQAGDKTVLLWEVRREEDKTSIYGKLIGRELDEGGFAGPSRYIHSGGYSYSVPKDLPETSPPSLDNPPSLNVLPLSFLRFEAEGMEILSGDFPSLPRKDASTEVPAPNPEDWSRWSPTGPEDFPGPGVDRIDQGNTEKETFTGREFRIFWADTHCHSIMSPDAEGELDELILYARDRAGLDIVSIVDNDFYPHKALTRAEWAIKQELALSFSKEGLFLVLPGYEYASHLPEAPSEFNHRCVLYTGKGGPFWGRMHRDTETWEGALKKLRAEQAIIYPHHCGYTIADNEVEKNVEIVSSWRTCIEETDFTWEQLNEGRKLGFIGSSDGHRQVPGMGGAITGVLAEELTRRAVHEAYHQRRLIATQGNRCRVDFRVGDVYIGSRGELIRPPRVECWAHAPGRIKSIRIFRNGDCIFEAAPNEKSLSLSFQDDEIPQGQSWYFCRVALVGRDCLNSEKGEKSGKASLFPFTNNSPYPHNMANAEGPLSWTSPVFINYSPDSNKEL